MKRQDDLYLSILNTIKAMTAGTDMQVGEVRAVLSRIDRDIISAANPNRVKFVEISVRLTGKEPRE